MRISVKQKLKNVSINEKVKFLNKGFSKNRRFLQILDNVFGIGVNSAKEILRMNGYSSFIKVGKVSNRVLSFVSDFLLNYLLVERGLRRFRNNLLMSYKDSGNIRGTRLFNGLPVNGQRSHTNASTVRRMFKFYKFQE